MLYTCLYFLLFFHFNPDGLSVELNKSNLIFSREKGHFQLIISTPIKHNDVKKRQSGIFSAARSVYFLEGIGNTHLWNLWEVLIYFCLKIANFFVVFYFTSRTPSQSSLDCSSHINVKHVNRFTGWWSFHNFCKQSLLNSVYEILRNKFNAQDCMGQEDIVQKKDLPNPEFQSCP